MVYISQSEKKKSQFSQDLCVFFFLNLGSGRTSELDMLGSVFLEGEGAWGISLIWNSLTHSDGGLACGPVALGDYV